MDQIPPVLLSRTWDSRTRTRTRTWKLVLEDRRGQKLSSRTTTQQCCEAVRWDRHELEPDRGTMANKFVTQSPKDDSAWYFACYVSLLNPRKFSRTWTSEDEDEDKDFARGQ